MRYGEEVIGMPSFTPSLEKSLHKALMIASDARQEYATLEHLLLALLDDVDAKAVINACNVDIEQLRSRLVQYVQSELDEQIGDEEDNVFSACHPTRGHSCSVSRT